MMKSSFHRTLRSPSHPWAAYVEASNSFDLDRLMITFAEDALVNDAADKRGLPDPLVLAFYFTAQSDLIVQPIILPNRYDI